MRGPLLVGLLVLAACRSGEAPPSAYTAAAENDPELNANLIRVLAEARGEQHLDLMRGAFESGRVDESICGAWEVVQAEVLGTWSEILDAGAPS